MQAIIYLLICIAPLDMIVCIQISIYFFLFEAYSSLCYQTYNIKKEKKFIIKSYMLIDQTKQYTSFYIIICERES